MLAHSAERSVIDNPHYHPYAVDPDLLSINSNEIHNAESPFDDIGYLNGHTGTDNTGSLHMRKEEAEEEGACTKGSLAIFFGTNETIKEVDEELEIAARRGSFRLEKSVCGSQDDFKTIENNKESDEVSLGLSVLQKPTEPKAKGASRNWFDMSRSSLASLGGISALIPPRKDTRSRLVNYDASMAQSLNQSDTGPLGKSKQWNSHGDNAMNISLGLSKSSFGFTSSNKKKEQNTKIFNLEAENKNACKDNKHLQAQVKEMKDRIARLEVICKWQSFTELAHVTTEMCQAKSVGDVAGKELLEAQTQLDSMKKKVDEQAELITDLVREKHSRSHRLIFLELLCLKHGIDTSEGTMVIKDSIITKISSSTLETNTSMREEIDLPSNAKDIDFDEETSINSEDDEEATLKDENTEHSIMFGSFNSGLSKMSGDTTIVSSSRVSRKAPLDPDQTTTTTTAADILGNSFSNISQRKSPTSTLLNHPKDTFASAAAPPAPPALKVSSCPIPSSRKKLGQTPRRKYRSKSRSKSPGTRHKFKGNTTAAIVQSDNGIIINRKRTPPAPFLVRKSCGGKFPGRRSGRSKSPGTRRKKINDNDGTIKVTEDISVTNAFDADELDALVSAPPGSRRKLKSSKFAVEDTKNVFDVDDLEALANAKPGSRRKLKATRSFPGKQKHDLKKRSSSFDQASDHGVPRARRNRADRLSTSAVKQALSPQKRSSSLDRPQARNRAVSEID